MNAVIGNRLASRGFNVVTVGPERGVLTKASTQRWRLRDEFEWYGSLPADLRHLAPAVGGWQDDGAIARFVIEHCGQGQLADKYTQDAYAMQEWRDVLTAAFRVHDALRAHERDVTGFDVAAMYMTKTQRRLKRLAASADSWKSLLSQDKVRANGAWIAGLPVLWDEVERRVRCLAASVRGSIVHGDYCFSNIVVGTTPADLRLIDPRGRFGHRGIHGDPRYDIAKLRHSAVNRYDFIIANRFVLEWYGSELIGRVEATRTAAAVAGLCDAFIVAAGYDLDEIRLIEALLFLSMTPLHSDAPRRQAMMLLTGLILLNEVIR